MAEDREIAGVRCLQILARLDDYLDGEMEPELRSKVDAHLAECEWCTKFGGRYASAVQALRSEAPRDPERGIALARQLLGRTSE